MKSRIMLALLFAAVFSASGCAVVVGDRVMGVESGQFINTDGTLRSDFRYTLDQVWEASIKALLDLKATDVMKDRKISKGELDALLSQEKVKVTVLYVEKELTSVSIRVGLTGNNLASRMIMDRIRENLAKSGKTASGQ
jgi:hypothetical protein